MQHPARTPAKFTPKKLKPLPVVSDHALIRYFERVLQLDVEAIRETILTMEQKAQVLSGAENIIKLAPGVSAVVRAKRVVTIK